MKIHKIQSKIKMLLNVFIDYEALVHHEFLLSGQTVNKELCAAFVNLSAKRGQNYGRISHGFCIMTIAYFNCCSSISSQELTKIIPKAPYYFLFNLLKNHF